MRSTDRPIDCVLDTRQDDICMIDHDVCSSTFANMKKVSAKRRNPFAAAADLVADHSLVSRLGELAVEAPRRR